MEPEGFPMRFDLKAMTITAGLIWGSAMFLTGLANLIWSGYGQPFLDVMASVYPGYDATASLREVIVGTVYGLVDGAMAGLVFAWVYNRFATRHLRAT
jgi:hypothetical protein